jgi:hypothetical protein
MVMPYCTVFIALPIVLVPTVNKSFPFPGTDDFSNTRRGNLGELFVQRTFFGNIQKAIGSPQAELGE